MNKKRIFDIVFTAPGVLLLSPFLAGICLWVKLDSKGTVFFKQTRVGLHGKKFQLCKFRTMVPNAEALGLQLTTQQDNRVTRAGQFLRRLKLDELPQLLNVLKGDMSLVGPRPERPGLIAGFKHKIPHYNARHMYPPGITGWAQVNGWRGNTSLEERIRHDIWYMEHWSLWLDFRIMVQTFYKRKNAY